VTNLLGEGALALLRREGKPQTRETYLDAIDRIAAKLPYLRYGRETS